MEYLLDCNNKSQVFLDHLFQTSCSSPFYPLLQPIFHDSEVQSPIYWCLIILIHKIIEETSRYLLLAVQNLDQRDLLASKLFSQHSLQSRILMDQIKWMRWWDSWWIYFLQSQQLEGIVQHEWKFFFRSKLISLHNCKSFNC